MDDFISLLENTADAVATASGRSQNLKLQRQLVIAAMQLRSLAIQIRRGVLSLDAASLAVCTRETQEARVAAEAADSEATCAAALVEANEAVASVASHALPTTKASLGFNALSGRGTTGIAGLTPIPPDFDPPRVWPFPPIPRVPRPWPMPWPWPFPPFPNAGMERDFFW